MGEESSSYIKAVTCQLVEESRRGQTSLCLWCCRYRNHEKSKKHKEKLALLKQLMQEEEEADNKDACSGGSGNSSAGGHSLDGKSDDDGHISALDTSGDEPGLLSPAEDMVGGYAGGGEGRGSGPCSGLGNSQELENVAGVEEGLNLLRIHENPASDLSDQEQLLLLPRR